MASEQFLAAVCGGTIGLGITFIVRGLWPPRPADDAGPRSPGAMRRLFDRLFDLLFDLGRDPREPRGGSADSWWKWRWAVAPIVGLVICWSTGWPVAGLCVAACIVVAAPMVVASGAGMRAIERAEAAGIWARRLVDVLAVGVPLEQAVAATVDVCPAAVRRPVGDLAARFAAGTPAEPALRAFADDVADAAVDLLAATLILGQRRRGPELAQALAAAVDLLVEDVTNRRMIEAAYARPRSKARAAAVSTFALVVIASFNTTYLRPYATPIGQVVLGAMAAVLAGGLFRMHALSRPRPALRLLADGGQRIPAPRREGEAFL